MKSRIFSILRRKPGLIDLITPIRPWTEGIDGYRLKTDTTPSGSFSTTVLTAPRYGFVDPAVAGPHNVIQPGDNCRIIIKPSNYSLPDSGSFWVKLVYTIGGVEQTTPAPSAPSLVLPVYAGPVTTGFGGTAPNAADISGSLQIDLPRGVENLRVRNLDSTRHIFFATDDSGPEMEILNGVELPTFQGVVSSIWVRASGGTAAFTASFSYGFPR